MINYYKGDLFSAAGKDTALIHACNCKGSWGAGIALQFKKRYPDAFTRYNKLCKQYGDELLGFSIEYYNQQLMYFLFTSKGYGKNTDSEKQILNNTKNCIENLLSGGFPEEIEIHSPKINAGLFRVPWSKTAKIIEEQLEKYPKIKWVVWEQ